MNPVSRPCRPAVRLAHLAFAALALLLAACGSGGRPPVLALEGTTMGTLYSIKVAHPPAGLQQDALAARITAELDSLVALFSTYEPDSVLARVNASRSTDWLDVPAALVEVLAEARRVSELSDGAFDVTVGPLVDLWGFGPVFTGDRIPEPAAIEALRARVGYANIELRTDPPGLRKAHPEIRIDLSAIAKGYAVDRIAALLEADGIDNYLVDIGGELRGRGHNAAGAPWRIGIEHPVAGEHAVQAVIGIEAIGVATSGDYRNFFERDGQRYSHTIDPRTGRPVTHALASVTVIDPQTMRADALATALLVLGPEAGYALAERAGLAALFISRGAEGLVERETAAFGRYRLAGTARK